MTFQNPGRQHEAHGAPPQAYVQPQAVGKSTRSRGSAHDCSRASAPSLGHRPVSGSSRRAPKDSLTAPRMTGRPCQRPLLPRPCPQSGA